MRSPHADIRAPEEKGISTLTVYRSIKMMSKVEAAVVMQGAWRRKAEPTEPAGDAPGFTSTFGTNSGVLLLQLAEQSRVMTPPGVMSAQTATQVLRTPRSTRRMPSSVRGGSRKRATTTTTIQTPRRDRVSRHRRGHRPGSTASPVASPAAAMAATRRSTEGGFRAIVEQEEAGEASFVPAGANYVVTDEQTVDASVTQQDGTTKVENEASAWGRYYDESEQTFYWYNTTTGESSWSDPRYSS